MSTGLDIPKLRAEFEAATPGKWYADSGPWMGLHFGVLAAGAVVADCTEILPEADRRNAIHIVSAHNSFEALLDRAEQADRYEAENAALREKLAAREEAKWNGSCRHD